MNKNYIRHFQKTFNKLAIKWKFNIFEIYLLKRNYSHTTTHIEKLHEKTTIQ